MTGTLRPRDVVTCGNPHCRAQATAAFWGQWQEGYPVHLAWPCGRTEVTHIRPERCLPCHERFMALGHDSLPPSLPAPRDAGGDLSIAVASPAPPPPVANASREVPSNAAPDVLRWCVDDAGDVPAWVVTLTGLRTREAIVKKWGPGARFCEPRSDAGRGPCADGAQDAARGTTRPEATAGFKAPVEPPASAHRAQLSLFGGRP